MGAPHPKAPWVPILLRSAIAAVYGGLTIFWQEPTLSVLAIAGGLYFVFTGLSLWRMSALARSCRVPQVPGALLVAAALYAVAGVVVALAQSTTVFAYVGGAALLVGGLIEFAFWFRVRKDFTPARDWLITGAAAIGAAALMPAFLALAESSHVRALLGVSGGSAVIIAVVLAISGLGLRHDASLAPESGEPSKAVN
ncbi:DUF308 domain-containing protein [Arthrobacter koreensis]|uniref:DUF308 domain-containing protein n=1 Tax=Arthrobacter koreensis TaxID=199136 RepID=UPI002DBA12D6|nr:DUF308 domain-containing protein [Arthrobacter koreensis]MEB7447144.1 hypothetical protein [Arthrobacter koreensis]